jgi:hypothetical protein
MQISIISIGIMSWSCLALATIQCLPVIVIRFASYCSGSNLEGLSAAMLAAFSFCDLDHKMAEMPLRSNPDARQTCQPESLSMESF